MSTEPGREKRWTPGPWSVRRKSWGSAIWIAVGGEKCPELCAEPIGEVYGHKSTEVAEANARLIAAAPELLAACEAFLRAPSVGSDGPGSSTIVVQDYNRRAARAAIDKAYGEES